MTQATPPTSASNTSGNHDYFRPSTDQVSGVPGNAKQFHRSPCPALNSLANRGFIDREGKNLTPQKLEQAVIQVFNIAPSFAHTLTKSLPATFTLADLGKHNWVEHDASLVHDDAWYGHDPCAINHELAQQLFAKAKNDCLDTKIMGLFRAKRERDCHKDNPEYSLTMAQSGIALGEAALVLVAMGDYHHETIQVETARSFLVDERIPSDFAKSTTAIGTWKIGAVIAKIKAHAMFGCDS